MRLLRCPKCYEEIAEISRRCQFCKAYLTLAEDRRRFLFVKITCPRCQHFNYICHRYCGRCALPLTKHCPQCGLETLHDTWVCGRCRHHYGHVPQKRRRRAPIGDPVGAETPPPEIPGKPSGGDGLAEGEARDEPVEGETPNRPEADGPPCILVVDDEPFIGKLLKTLLELEGYTVDVAGNAAEARVLVNERPPRLVITDIMMPGDDGYALLRELKSRPETRPIQVIILSVLSDFEDVKRSTVSGAVDHLAKPFEPAALLWAVKRALGEYHAWEKREDLLSV